MTTQSTAVAKANAAVAAKPQVSSIHDLIQSSINQLRVALPSHMSAERIARIALTTIRMNPKLMECTPQSFLGALFQSAQLGLEPNVNGESWIIPYKNSKKVGDAWVKVMEAQFQVGAYGWVKLFYNHQNSVTLQMASVHQNDEFTYDLGTSMVHHIPPTFGKDRGPTVGYYALASMSNGGKVLKTMSRQEAHEHAKKHSKCWSKDENDFMKGTPWKDHFDAMGEVTVLKQVMKLVPKSVEIQRALAMDQTTKTKIDADMMEVADETNWTDAEVVEPQKLEEKKETRVEQPKEIPQTGDPVKDKSAKEKATIEGIIRTLKTEASIKKVFEQIEEKAKSGDLIEADRIALLETLQTKQDEIQAGEKAESSTASEKLNEPVRQPKAGDGFDPYTEVVQFGKHKGKKWTEVPTTWLQWLAENTDDKTKKEKAEATIRAKGGETEEPA